MFGKILLDAIQKRSICIIGKPELTDSLPPLSHMRKVEDLCLFYRYFNGDSIQLLISE